MRLLLAVFVRFLLLASPSVVEGASWVVGVPLEGHQFHPRSAFGAYVDVTGNDQAILFGGKYETNFSNNDATFYNDLVSLTKAPGGNGYLFGLLSTIGTLPPARAYAGFAVTAGYMLVVGGIAGATTPLSDSWLFNRATQEWTDVTEGGPPARTQSQAVASEDGKFYVYGGFGLQGAVLGDYWRFDPLTANWTELTVTQPLGGGLTARYGHRGIMVGNDKAYFYGGIDSLANINLYLTDTILANGTSGDASASAIQISLLNDPNAPARRNFGFTSIFGGSTFLLTGGSRPNGTQACGSPLPLDGARETFVFDRASETWSELDTLGTSHGGIIDGAAVSIDGDVIMLGGYYYECGNETGSAGQVYNKNVWVLSFPTSAPTGSPTSALQQFGSVGSISISPSLLASFLLLFGSWILFG